MKHKKGIAKTIIQAHLKSINWDEGDLSLLEENINKGLEEAYDIGFKEGFKQGLTDDDNE